MGPSMAKQNIDKSFYEELFGGELDVMENPDRCGKTKVRIHKDRVNNVIEKAAKRSSWLEIWRIY